MTRANVSARAQSRPDHRSGGGNAQPTPLQPVTPLCAQSTTYTGGASWTCRHAGSSVTSIASSNRMRGAALRASAEPGAQRPPGPHGHPVVPEAPFREVLSGKPRAERLRREEWSSLTSNLSEVKTDTQPTHQRPPDCRLTVPLSGTNRRWGRAHGPAPHHGAGSGHGTHASGRGPTLTSAPPAARVVGLRTRRPGATPTVTGRCSARTRVAWHRCQHLGCFRAVCTLTRPSTAA